MNFTMPKKNTMKKLYRLVKKFYKSRTYDFFEMMDQRIFFIASDKENFVIILSPDERKFEIFYGEDGFLCCHNLLSGDDRSLRSYGLNSIMVEENENDGQIYGLEHYKKTYKFYKNNDKEIIYVANKSGQKPLMVDEVEAVIILDVIQKLLFIVKGLKKQGYKRFADEMVCVFDFGKSNKKFEVNYELLETFDFFPTFNYEPITDGRLSKKLRELEVKPGTLHIGQVYGFSTYEIYDNIADIEIALCPIYFYGITDEGDLSHMIYSSPKEESNMISSALATMYFEKYGLYDTIITDNIYVYNNLHYIMKSIGVELKFELNDPMNIFVTNFMIKMSQINSDVSGIDEMINESKKELKEIILTSEGNLDELNETFFVENFEEVIVEESTEEEKEDFEEDTPSEYVS